MGKGLNHSEKPVIFVCNLIMNCLKNNSTSFSEPSPLVRGVNGMGKNKMALYIKSKIIIDRIRITGMALSKQQYKVFLEQLYKLIHFSKEHISKGLLKKFKNGYRHILQYTLGQGQPVIQIEAGSTKAKKFYLAWELWPHRFKKADLAGFFKLINLLLDSPVFLYKSAFYKGKVRYLELSSDRLTEPMYSFIPWKDKVQKSFFYENEETKEKGALYLGGKQSAVRYCFYDKAKQLKHKKLPCKYKTLTRIEARLNHLHLAPAKLHELKNPFESLHIAHAINCKNYSKDEILQNFISQAEKEGAANAFKGLNKKERSEIKKILMACEAKWWQPEKLADEMLLAFETIAPPMVVQI